MTETIHTLVIGGGQAGVTTSAHLQKLVIPTVITYPAISQLHSNS